MAKHPRIPAVVALVLTALSLGACGHNPAGLGPTAQLSDRECMARVMYFESNRSSDDGMLAVGTVVMNRLQSPKYPKSVCGVVGQTNQFAEGALTKGVNKRHSSWARSERAADAVLAGERHAGVGAAMFFHTNGYSYPYRNMKYVTLAGGNIFYDKRYPAPGAPAWPSANAFARAYGTGEKTAPVLVAEAVREPAARTRPVVVASAETLDDEPVQIRKPAPVVARETTREPEPVLRNRPVLLATSSGAEQKRRTAPATAPFRPETKAVVAAKIEPPTKPKPIVLAMLDTKARPGSLSIAELIARDSRKR